MVEIVLKQFVIDQAGPDPTPKVILRHFFIDQTEPFSADINFRALILDYEGPDGTAKVVLKHFFPDFQAEPRPEEPVLNSFFIDFENSLIPQPAPEVINIDPPEGLNTSALLRTVYGNFFQPGILAWFQFEDGSPEFPITITPTSVTSTSFEITVPAGLTSGLYHIRVENPDGREDKSFNAYTVLLPAPIIDSLTDDTGGDAEGFWNVNNIVTIHGHNFVEGCTVKVGTVTLTPVFISDIELTVTLLSLDFLTGTHAFQVKNPDLQVSNNDKVYTIIDPGPELISIIPNSKREDEDTEDIIISMKYYVPGTTCTVGGLPASVMDIDYNPMGITTFTIDIGPSALSVGTYPVIASNINGTDTKNAWFTVNPPAPPAPEITTIGPDNGFNTAPVNVTVKGSNLSEILDEFTLENGGSIPLTIVSMDPGGTWVIVTIPAGLDPGPYTIKVNRPSEGQSDLADDPYIVRVPQLPIETKVVTRLSIRDPLIPSTGIGSMGVLGKMHICRVGKLEVKPEAFFFHIYDTNNLSTPVAVICPQIEDIPDISNTEVLSVGLSAPLIPGWSQVSSSYHKISSVIETFSKYKQSGEYLHNHKYQIVTIGVYLRVDYENLIDDFSDIAEVLQGQIWETYPDQMAVENDRMFFTVYDKKYLEIAAEED